MFFGLEMAKPGNSGQQWALWRNWSSERGAQTHDWRISDGAVRNTCKYTRAA